MNVHELAKKYEDYMLDLRHYFHMHPELGLHEENTSKRIQEELGKMGVPYEVVGNRNVVGKIVGAKPGKALAIRADIDALPMQEEIDWEYKSTVPGVMHACGHDVHAHLHYLLRQNALLTFRTASQVQFTFASRLPRKSAAAAHRIFWLTLKHSPAALTRLSATTLQVRCR